MPSRHLQKDRASVVNHAILLAILSLAAYLRIYGLDLIEFKADEADTLLRVQAIYEGKGFEYLGAELIVDARLPSSLYYYILLIPRVISGDPRVFTLFIALFNIASVYLVYILALCIYNHRFTGLLAAAIYSSLPWAVLFSRKIWNPELVPFFVILAMIWLIKGARQRTGHLAMPSVLSMLIALNLHPSMLNVLPVYLVMLIAFSKRVGRRWVIMSLVIALFLQAAIFIPDLVNGAENTKALISGLFVKGGEFVPRWEGIDSMMRFLSADGISSIIAGNQMSGFFFSKAYITLWKLIFLLSILWGSFEGYAYLKYGKQRSSTDEDQLGNQLGFFVFLWLIVPVFINCLIRDFVALHYNLPAIPAAMLLMGRASAAPIKALSNTRYKIIGTVTGVIILVAVALNAMLIIELAHFLDASGGVAGSYYRNYGTIYRHKADATSFIVELACMKKAKMIVSHSFRFDSPPRKEYQYLLDYYLARKGDDCLPQGNLRLGFVIINTHYSQLSEAQEMQLSDITCATFGPVRVYYFPLQQ